MVNEWPIDQSTNETCLRESLAESRAQRVHISIVLHQRLRQVQSISWANLRSLTLHQIWWSSFRGQKTVFCLGPTGLTLIAAR